MKKGLLALMVLLSLVATASGCGANGRRLAGRPCAP